MIHHYFKGSSFSNWSFRASVDVLCDSLALKGRKIMAIQILNYRNLDTSLLSMPFKSELFQIYHHRDPLTASFNLLAEGWSKTEGSLQLVSFNNFFVIKTINLEKMQNDLKKQVTFSLLFSVYSFCFGNFLLDCLFPARKNSMKLF